MYQHQETGTPMTLHDCQAHQAAFADGALTLYFPDGIGLMPGHPENDTAEDIIMTTAAEVRFPLTYPEEPKHAVTVYAFSREDSHGECKRKPWTLKKLLKKVDDAHRLEVVTLYTCETGVLLKCYLWFDEEPYSKALEIEIVCQAPVYCWDELSGEIR